MTAVLALFFTAGHAAPAADFLAAPRGPAGQRQQLPADGPAGESSPSVLCARHAAPPAQALRQDQPRGFESRRPAPGTSVGPVGGTPGVPSPRWRPRPGTRRPAHPQPSLRVLFCAWLE